MQNKQQINLRHLVKCNKLKINTTNLSFVKYIKIKLNTAKTISFRWLYLANKKHAAEQQEANDRAKTEESLEKSGIDNKAYEAEEKNKTTDGNLTEETPTANPSQIEMGFTESMVSSSKL